jgi:hypothetical protein
VCLQFLRQHSLQAIDQAGQCPAFDEAHAGVLTVHDKFLHLQAHCCWLCPHNRLKLVLPAGLTGPAWQLLQHGNSPVSTTTESW